MTNFRLQNLSKTYSGGVTAIHSLSLDIAEGELVVLAGPSGCGSVLGAPDHGTAGPDCLIERQGAGYDSTAREQFVRWVQLRVEGTAPS